MRYAIVPQHIGLRNPKTGTAEFVTFKNYLTQFVFDDLRWQRPLTNMARLPLVMRECEKAPGELLEWEDADHRILVDILTNPLYHEKSGLPLNLPSPLFALQLQPFVDAVLNASPAKPVLEADGKLNGEASVHAVIDVMHAGS